MTTMIIERARTADAEAVLALLRRNGLPTTGLVEHIGMTLIARAGGRIVGSAALERYADGVLLRSVAVAPEFQGRGLGRQLTTAAIQLARDVQAPAMFLLTTTADGYFPKFGFARIDRAAVPRSVQTSVEFTSACPSSAIVMRLGLAETRP